MLRNKCYSSYCLLNSLFHHRTFFSGLCLYMHRGSASRIVLRDASRIMEQQKQQHSSRGGGDVAAAAAASSPLESWAVVLCLRYGACALHPGSGPFTSRRVAFYSTAAPYLLRCCCCDDHGRRREENPSPSDWKTLPSEPSDPSHCLLDRSTRSAGCRVANSIREKTMIDLKKFKI